jgi:hypothetical protein
MVDGKIPQPMGYPGQYAFFRVTRGRPSLPAGLKTVGITLQM